MYNLPAVKGSSSTTNSFPQKKGVGYWGYSEKYALEVSLLCTLVAVGEQNHTEPASAIKYK